MELLVGAELYPIFCNFIQILSSFSILVSYIYVVYTYIYLYSIHILCILVYCSVTIEVHMREIYC